MFHLALKFMLTAGLIFGLVVGFCGTFAHGRFAHGGHHRQQFEAHIADVCLQAARRESEKGEQ